MAVTDKDNGMRAMQARLADLQTGDGWTLEVGVLTAEEHTGAPGLTVADVAAFHEFGLGVPQRSFIGGWFDENTKTLQVRATSEIQSYIKGSRTKDVILNRLGSYCVGGIQGRMSEGIPPPLAPSTIARKGSSVPLIDTGQLRTSVTYRIKP